MSVPRPLLNALALAPLLILLVGIPLGLYWLFEPAPLTLQYVAPRFLSQPASNRREADLYGVDAVKGGAVVFRYVEFCVHSPFHATTFRSWVNDAMVWNAPAVPTMLSREVGCRSANLAVTVPTSNPTRTFDYVQHMEITSPVNPLKTHVIEYAPIRLTILAN